MKTLDCPPELKKYTGTKEVQGLYHAIINHIPPHFTYIEPFAGSAAIMRYKRPADRNIINDIDKDVFNTWKKYRCEWLTVQNMNGIDLVAYYLNAGPDTFIYADPPYLKTSRRAQYDLYSHEMNESDHIKLLDLLNKTTCRAMISGYGHELYYTKLNRWTRVEVPTMTHGGRATEIIWFNYPIPERLHDYRYLGKNWHDRQRIRRKLRLLTNKLNNLPPLERNAILHHLNHNV